MFSASFCLLVAGQAEPTLWPSCADYTIAVSAASLSCAFALGSLSGDEMLVILYSALLAESAEIWCDESFEDMVDAISCIAGSMLEDPKKVLPTMLHMI